MERESNIRHLNGVVPIEGVRELQGIYSYFSRSINPEQTPDSLLGMLKTEVDELGDELRVGDRHTIGAEVADVILFAVEIANQHGIDLSQALGAKLTRNFHKYNPIRMQELVASGLTYNEASAKLKAEWDRSLDSNFK